MFRPYVIATCLICTLFIVAPARAANQGTPPDQITSVGVGTWEPGVKGGVDHIKVDGEDIYLNGVLQKAKFRPDADLVIRGGVVEMVPRAGAKAAPTAQPGK